MGKVCVACKVPNGINLGDGIIIAGPKNYGPATPQADRVFTIGGFAFTEIDEELWNRWFNANKDSVIVERGMVYAKPSMAEARQAALHNAPPRQFGTKWL